MTFSSKIYKLIDGKNISLFSSNQNEINLYIFDKSTKKYSISENLNKKCVFLKSYSYDKIIELNDKKFAVCCNDFITIAGEDDLQ